MNTLPLPASVLVKHQVKTYGPKFYTENGTRYRITAKVRYDDQCGNGHNSFSITADIDRNERGIWRDDAGGCCHDEVAKHFPQLAPFIKWHLTSSDGPMHYVANTVYHATEHGPKSAWIYYQSQETYADPEGIFEAKEHKFSKYVLEPAEALKVEGKPGYIVKWDEKSAKVRNLDHARSCAVWPDATAEQLLDEDALAARLPALIVEFKSAIESLGLTY